MCPSVVRCVTNCPQKKGGRRDREKQNVPEIPQCQLSLIQYRQLWLKADGTERVDVRRRRDEDKKRE